MGKCRRGEKCPFKHENKSEECIFYKRGHCSRGNECRYVHKKEEITNPNQNNYIERRRQPKSTQIDQRNQQTSERCKEFDRGYCSRKNRCPLKHCKDRLTDEMNRTEDERSTPANPSQESQNQNQNRCADFDEGFCPRRSRCHLKHLKDRIAPESTGINRCRDFDRGYCPRRSMCRYSHQKDRLSMSLHQTNRQHQYRSEPQPNSGTGRSIDQNHQRHNETPAPSRRD